MVMNGEEFRAVYASMWTYDMAMCPVVWCYPSLGTVVIIQTWLELDSSGPAPALSYALIYCCRCTKWWETMTMILLTIVMVFSYELSLVASYFYWDFLEAFSVGFSGLISPRSHRNLLKSQNLAEIYWNHKLLPLGNKLVHLRLEILIFWDFSGC